MIKRAPPSPDKLSKLAGSLSELFSSDPFCLLNASGSKIREENVNSVIKRLKERKISPDCRHPVRQTPLIFAAMKLPLEPRIKLVCAILQLGGNPMIAAHSKVQNCTFLHGALTPENYYKPLAQLILSYGFDKNVFQDIVNQSAKNTYISGKSFVLSETETAIDPVYSELAFEIKQAMALWNNGESPAELEETKKLFTSAEAKLIKLAEIESCNYIKEDYQMRAHHCREKIDECTQKLVFEHSQPAANETAALLSSPRFI